MARVSLDPPQTLGYRIARFFVRRQFGEVLDPFRAMGHNMPVAQAMGKLEQSTATWNESQLIELTYVGTLDYGNNYIPDELHV